MKKTVILIVTGILAIAFIGTVLSASERGEREDEEYSENTYAPDIFGYGPPRSVWPGPRADVRPVADATYANECGACHFAYQPGLLSAQAWSRIMDTLSVHYGDDASLEAPQAEAIRRYLLDNAADRASESRSRAFAAGPAAGNALPRITATNYFRREHYEIPARFVEGNKEVRSFSNCQACHRTAETGVYNEHLVMIPGVGRWDD